MGPLAGGERCCGPLGWRPGLRKGRSNQAARVGHGRAAALCGRGDGNFSEGRGRRVGPAPPERGELSQNREAEQRERAPLPPKPPFGSLSTFAHIGPRCRLAKDFGELPTVVPARARAFHKVGWRGLGRFLSDETGLASRRSVAHPRPEIPRASEPCHTRAERANPSRVGFQATRTGARLDGGAPSGCRTLAESHGSCRQASPGKILVTLALTP